jgi:hypothetical protein
MAFFEIKSTCPSDFRITHYYEFCSKLYVHAVCLLEEVSAARYQILRTKSKFRYQKLEKFTQ